MVCGNAPQLVINEDARRGIIDAAELTDAARVARALMAVDETDAAIAANVSPETCFDVLLFQTREVLYGTHCTGYAAK